MCVWRVGGAEEDVALGRGGREGNCTANDRRRERKKILCGTNKIRCWINICSARAEKSEGAVAKEGEEEEKKEIFFYVQLRLIG